ncbi:glutathione reductase [Oceaniovalibus guishaninsula JLT2003]|uniref:Glutathione reductase n=1 Tax=Oceaniovalibus guishaninsula JLT2003 TaxID=1231392 RepID=K2GNX8_9RHOB|nr:glutathione-disulfide reductase [Oceaniovalibus guishaninsula]EKE44391.1 glutathione reductase [Oceaniovalibus guishaninsula JLT2003]
MSFDYDLFVIGGGSGGVRAARMAAATGARVALAEEDRMGGTCVIRGCVPKKMMVFASGYGHAADEARDYGWSAKAGTFHWPQFRTRLRGELDRLEQIYRSMLDTSGVEIVDQRATLAGPHEVALADGTRRSAAHILIATGGHPVRPDIENADLGMVSDDIFLMDELPKSVLIVGGGYIACEFACILNGLGVKVTQYYRGAQILRGFDDEARGLISEAMLDQGIGLHLGTNILRMGPGDAGGIRVESTTGGEGTFDRVLFATGRRPSTEGLGLEEIGVTLGRNGEIVVDGYSQSSVPSVYAIGDVTGRVALTPVAIREGMAFVRTVFEGVKTPADHDRIPSAVFTRPELGTVGLTEGQARDREEVEVYCTSFRPMQQAFIGRKDRVLMKLIVSRRTRVVLGCHIVAQNAGEMIQLAGIAVKAGLTKDQFDATCAVHPTMAEELVTMREPVRSG